MSERGQYTPHDMEFLGFKPPITVLLLSRYNNLPAGRTDTLLEFLLAYIDNFDLPGQDMVPREAMNPREAMTAMGVNEAMQDSILHPDIAQFTDNGRDWHIILKDFVDGRMEGLLYQEREAERKEKEEKLLMNVDVSKLDRRNVVATVNFNGPAPKVWHGCLVLTEEMQEEMKEEELRKGEQSKL